MTRSNKTVRAPKAAPLKAKKPKQPKAEPRLLEHKHFGVGAVTDVFETASGNTVVDVTFAGGIARTLSLEPQFWIGDIADMLAMPLRPRKPEAKLVHKPEPADDAVDADTSELELNAAGHLGEIENAGKNAEEESESAEAEELAEV